MKHLAFGWLLLCMATACFGQDQAPLCPRHIETPNYPAIARAAHISGKITLKVTIGADGNVEHVDTTTENPGANGHRILMIAAAENMRRWTFAKPPSAPHTQVIAYDYEFNPSITKTTFDLPDRVSITTDVATIEVQSSRIRN